MRGHPKGDEGKPVHLSSYLFDAALILKIRALERLSAAFAMAEELAALGVSVDQKTGYVTIAKLA